MLLSISLPLSHHVSTVTCLIMAYNTQKTPLKNEGWLHFSL